MKITVEQNSSAKEIEINLTVTKQTQVENIGNTNLSGVLFHVSEVSILVTNAVPRLVSVTPENLRSYTEVL